MIEKKTTRDIIVDALPDGLNRAEFNRSIDTWKNNHTKLKIHKSRNPNTSTKSINDLHKICKQTRIQICS